MLNLRGSQSAAQTIVLRRKDERAKSRTGASRRGLASLFSLVLCALGLFSVPGTAFAHLQCVPYAREQSGIDIYGDARTWWKQAGGVYARGDVPKVGAVMAMAPSSAMPLGHVAVVAKVVDQRHVLLNHANWSRPGMIETGVMAEDVSNAGDWSEVRVWYAPTGSLGTRANPVYGFIYPEAPEAQPTNLANAPIQIAVADTGKVNM